MPETLMELLLREEYSPTEWLEEQGLKVDIPVNPTVPRFLAVQMADFNTLPQFGLHPPAMNTPDSWTSSSPWGLPNYTFCPQPHILPFQPVQPVQPAYALYATDADASPVDNSMWQWSTTPSQAFGTLPRSFSGYNNGEQLQLDPCTAAARWRAFTQQSAAKLSVDDTVSDLTELTESEPEEEQMEIDTSRMVTRSMARRLAAQGRHCETPGSESEELDSEEPEELVKHSDSAQCTSNNPEKIEPPRRIVSRRKSNKKAGTARMYKCLIKNHSCDPRKTYGDSKDRNRHMNNAPLDDHWFYRCTRCNKGYDRTDRIKAHCLKGSCKGARWTQVTPTPYWMWPEYRHILNTPPLNDPLYKQLDFDAADN